MGLGLIIDTSSERGMLAICREKEVLQVTELSFGYAASRELIPEIHRLFNSQGIGAKDLSFIAIGTGPGSYTGIRVGAAAAQSLAFSRDLPLIGISSLSGFVPENGGPFGSIMDARSGGAYFSAGEFRNGEVIGRHIDLLIPWEALKDHLAHTPTLVTANAEPLKKRFEANGIQADSFQWLERAPDAGQLAALAWTEYQEGTFSTEAELEFSYLR